MLINKKVILNIVLKLGFIITTFIFYLFIFFISFLLNISIDDKCGIFDIKKMSPISHTPCIERGASVLGSIVVVIVNILVFAFLIYEIFKFMKYIWDLCKGFEDDKNTIQKFSFSDNHIDLWNFFVCYIIFLGWW